MGRAMYARGKTRKAVTAHRTAVEITPDDPNAYVGLGLALAEEGYIEDATVALKTAVELGGGTDASVNYRLGAAFAKQRQFPFACQALRWCVSQNPRHLDAWFELAAALRKVKGAASSVNRPFIFLPSYLNRSFFPSKDFSSYLSFLGPSAQGGVAARGSGGVPRAPRNVSLALGRPAATGRHGARP